MTIARPLALALMVAAPAGAAAAEVNVGLLSCDTVADIVNGAIPTTPEVRARVEGYIEAAIDLSRFQSEQPGTRPSPAFVDLVAQHCTVDMPNGPDFRRPFKAAVAAAIAAYDTPERRAQRDAERAETLRLFEERIGRQEGSD